MCVPDPCENEMDENDVTELIRFRLLEYGMTERQLIKIIKGLLGADEDLDFLLQLKRDNLETLVACIRDRVDQVSSIKNKFQQ